AGKVAPVNLGIEKLKAVGCKRAMPLPVSAPFHTSLRRPAGDKLKEAMAALRFNAPQIPVGHNVSAKSEADPGKMNDILLQQIFSPVQWAACVKYMVSQGIATTVECGPGKVLSGLNKRIEKSLNCLGIDDNDGLNQALSALA